MYKPYTKDFDCPKCGSDLVTTDYDKELDLMKRHCSNCGYTEHQTPLDSQPVRPV